MDNKFIILGLLLIMHMAEMVDGHRLENYEERIARSILENMDESIDPCDNFFKFSCGKTIIPQNRPSGNPFIAAKYELKLQRKEILEETIKSNEIKPLTLPKVLYKSCMNEHLIEKQGLDPLKEILKELGGWPVLMGDEWKDENFNWTNIITKHRQIGSVVFYFMKFEIDKFSENSIRNAIHIGQVDLGLERDYLLKGMDDQVVRAYHKYMTDVAEILGANRELAAKELEKSLEFEIELAKISQQEAEIVPMSIRDLNKTHPKILWLEGLNIILAPTLSITQDKEIIVNNLGFIPKLIELLEQKSKRVMANCLMWKIIQSIAPYLNDVIQNKNFDFQSHLKGIAQRPERWEECVDLVYSRLNKSVDSLYARKYLNKESKAAAVEIFTKLIQELKKTLPTVEWMDTKTRNSAKEKAEFLGAEIAYADEIVDDEKLGEYYRNLELTPGSYLKNMINITKFETEKYLENFGKSVNIEIDWELDTFPMNMNMAYYANMKNALRFFMDKAFSSERPKYVNYGSIGWSMGHEISHGFLGKNLMYDKDGNEVDWWKPNKNSEYLKRLRCIAYQYGNYTNPIDGLKLNGTSSLNENLADNGGIKLAYQAYQQKKVIESRLPGLEEYTPQQMFWISAANFWCKDRKSDQVHIPAELRVIGSMSNMPEFSTDFKCLPGSRMNPVKKCSVW